MSRYLELEARTNGLINPDPSKPELSEAKVDAEIKDEAEKPLGTGAQSTCSETTTT